jgi:hypothetical protein
VVLRIPRLSSACVYGTLTLSGWPSQTLLLQLPTALARSYNPHGLLHRFRLLRFRSPLLAESSLFLRLLRCFSSPSSPPLRDVPVLPGTGFPIRTPPVARGCTRLTGAFRSVPRPSSALDAKASPVCPYSLLLPRDTERTVLSPFRTSFFSRATCIRLLRCLAPSLSKQSRRR